MRNEPLVEVNATYDLKDPKNPKLILTINNHDKVKTLDLVLEDQAYGKVRTEISLNPTSDGFLELDQAGSICSNGLDAYYTTELVDRYDYARPGVPVQKITTKKLKPTKVFI